MSLHLSTRFPASKLVRRDRSVSRSMVNEEEVAAVSIYHVEELESPLEVIRDLVNVRLHGTESKYEGSYPPKMLKK